MERYDHEKLYFVPTQPPLVSIIYVVLIKGPGDTKETQILKP